MQNNLKRHADLIFIIILGGLLRLINLNRLFSANELLLLMPDGGLREMLLEITLSRQLPLYPLFLSVWTSVVGDSELLIRLPQFVFGLVSLVLVYGFTKKIAKPLASTVTILLATSPLHIHLSNTLSTVMPALVLVQIILNWLVLAPKSRWLVTPVSLLAYLTHPFTWILIPVFAFFKRSFILPVIIGLLGFLAWAPYVPLQLMLWLQDIDPKPTLTPIFTSLKLLFVGSYSVTGFIYYVAMAIEAYLLAWVIGKSRTKTQFLSAVAGVPLLLALLIALVTAVPSKGLLLFTLIPLYVLFSIGLKHIEIPIKKTVILYVLILLQLTFAQAGLVQPKSPDWRGVVEAISEVVPETNTIVFPLEEIPTEWRWYSKDAYKTYAVAPQNESLARIVASTTQSFTMVIPGGAKDSLSLVDWFAGNGFSNIEWFEVRSFGYLVTVNRERPLALQ